MYLKKEAGKDVRR